MGMYGKVLDTLDDGLFVKVEPGRPVKLRILDHPYVSTVKYQSGDVATRFAWPVWDYQLEKVRILQQGKSIFKQIANQVENWPDGEAMPSPFDIVIAREGSGQYDTKYTVSAVPHAGTSPAKPELPDMAEKTGGLPLREVAQGAKPEVKQVGQSATLAALEAGETLPTDEQVSDINLDDIPF